MANRLCERCHGEIAAERLEMLPDTRICVRCSKDIGGEYTYRVVGENIGKVGSLKKNYGSFGVRKTRKRIEPLE
jgi:hypothetical protein